MAAKEAKLWKEKNNNKEDEYKEKEATQGFHCS